MSRMGNYNLQLQEQAEELGFSTTQEALDRGYHVVEDLVTNYATLKKLDEEELAHEAWLKEKENVLDFLRFGVEQQKKLLESRYNKNEKEATTAAKYAMEQAIKFIEGVKYEQ